MDGWRDEIACLIYLWDLALQFDSRSHHEFDIGAIKRNPYDKPFVSLCDELNDEKYLNFECAN